MASIEFTGPLTRAVRTGAETPEQLTHTGAAVGTADYMSPEQVEGKPLDARNDLFSFGAVLYEMATGASPFPGANPAEIFDAILHKNPTPITRLNLALPDELARIITRCLQKTAAGAMRGHQRFAPILNG
jgi:serine/threonine protein kinase